MRKPAVTRRTFLLAVGGGGAATIAGYFLLPSGWRLPARHPSTDAPEPHPCLRPDIAYGHEGDFTTIQRLEGGKPVLCGVNRAGAAILDHLRGKSPLAVVSDEAASELGIEPKDDFYAKAAVFVAQLAELGFLRDPFHVWVYCEEA